MSSEPPVGAVVGHAVSASLDVGVQIRAVVLLLAIGIGDQDCDHTYFNTAPLL